MMCLPRSTKVSASIQRSFSPRNSASGTQPSCLASTSVLFNSAICLLFSNPCKDIIAVHETILLPISCPYSHIPRELRHQNLLPWNCPGRLPRILPSIRANLDYDCPLFQHRSS